MQKLEPATLHSMQESYAINVYSKFPYDDMNILDTDRKCCSKLKPV